MKLGYRVGVAAAVCALCAAPLRAQGGNLQAVLAQMDAASQRFSNAQADFRKDYFEKVVNDTTSQSGPIYFERKGGDVQMGLVIVDPATKSAQRVIEYKDGELQMFEPGINQITVLHAGANQAEYESFLTLGFGGSGHDLAQAWNITDMGAASVAEDPGVKAEKLDLVSKDAKVRDTFTHITIWVDPARGVSLKQVFYTPSGDVQKAIYSNIKVNSRIDMKTFAIKKNSHTTVVTR